MDTATKILRRLSLSRAPSSTDPNNLYSEAPEDERPKSSTSLSFAQPEPSVSKTSVFELIAGATSASSVSTAAPSITMAQPTPSPAPRPSTSVSLSASGPAARPPDSADPPSRPSLPSSAEHRMIGAAAMMALAANAKKDGGGPAPISDKADLELSNMMVEYLLDNLQPYLWTDKKAAMQGFEEFIFKQFPRLTEDMAVELMIGRGGKGRGLLETIGGVSWRTGALRSSSVKAMHLLLHLLNPTNNPYAKMFTSVLKKVDKKHVESMALGKHLTNQGGHREGALKLIRFFHDLRPDVTVFVPKEKQTSAAEDTADPRLRKSSLFEAIQAAPEEAAFEKQRRMSTRSAMKDLIQKNILKPPTKPPPPPAPPQPQPRTERTATRIGAAIKDLFSAKKDKKSKPKNASPAETRKTKSHSFPHPDEPSSGNGLVFGIPLAKVYDNTCFRAGPQGGFYLPPVLTDCCEQIEQRGIKSVGIFRLPGNVRVVHEVKTNLDQAAAVDWAKLPVDVIANVVKLWFRELSEPIFTFELYSDFISAQQISDDSKRLAELKSLCDRLPDINRRVIAYLLSFLQKVASHEEANKMSGKNLCMVWAPNLLRPKVESYEVVLNDTPHVMGCVLTMLAHNQILFADEAMLCPRSRGYAMGHRLSHDGGTKGPLAVSPRMRGASVAIGGSSPAAALSSAGPSASEPPALLLGSSAPVPSVMSPKSGFALKAQLDEDDDFDLSDHESMTELDTIAEPETDTEDNAPSSPGPAPAPTEAKRTPPSRGMTHAEAAAAAAAAFAVQVESVQTVHEEDEDGEGPPSRSLSGTATPVRQGSNSVGDDKEAAPPTELPVLKVEFPPGFRAGSKKNSRAVMDARISRRQSKRTSVTADLSEGTPFTESEFYRQGAQVANSGSMEFAPVQLGQLIVSGPLETTVEHEDETAGLSNSSSKSANNLSPATAKAPADPSTPSPRSQNPPDEDADSDVDLASAEAYAAHQASHKGNSLSATLPDGAVLARAISAPLGTAPAASASPSAAPAPASPQKVQTEQAAPSPAAPAQSPASPTPSPGPGPASGAIAALPASRASSSQRASFLGFHLRTPSFSKAAENKEPAAAAAAASPAPGLDRAVSTSAVPTSAAVNALPGGANSPMRRWGYWIEYFNDEGIPYYFNTVTNDTQWEPPHGFVYRSRHSTIGSMTTMSGFN